LWLGLLAGVVFVVSKLLRTRGEAPATIDLRAPADRSEPAREPWPPLQTPPAPVETKPASVETPEPTLEEAQAPSDGTAALPKKTLPPWVAPEDGICPPTHPVKAKLSSGIFQVEGNAMYARTRPDRCYQTREAAAEDGLRPAKR
jgi:hypothetical protein